MFAGVQFLQVATVFVRQQTATNTRGIGLVGVRVGVRTLSAATTHTERVWAHERTELVALDVFTRATDAGEQVTRAMVERRLEQQRTHRPTCRCGRCEWLESGRKRPATVQVDDV